MNAKAVSVPASEASGTPAVPVQLMEELLRLLIKAARAHQLYLHNNPIYIRSLELVRQAFGALWAHTDELVLAVTDTDFRNESHVVLSEPTRSGESLPWLFYKDGIRELSFMRGFEGAELVALLDILPRVKKAASDEDDLLTIMWEQEFLHLRYRFVDLATDSAADLPAPPAELPSRVVPVQELIEEEEEPEGVKQGVVRMEDFDATLYFLDEQEIEYLRDEIRKEYEGDLRTNVLAMLFDVFEQQSDAAVRDEVCGVLDNLMLHMLSASNFSAVAYLLREAQTAVTRSRELAPEQRQKLVALPDRVSAPEALMQLLTALDESATLPPENELLELFDQLRPSALAPVFMGLRRLENAHLRPLLEGAAARLASQNTGELARLISAADREVAAEAIRRSGALKSPAAVGPLARVLTSTDAEMRLLAVRALSDIGSAGAMQSLERALDDKDRDARVSAIRTMGVRGHRAALPRIEAMVGSKAMREADLTEKMAVFEAFGALSGDAGVDSLDSILNAKGFLGRREDPELRACAAMALGKIGSERAHSVLRNSSAEREVLVRNAVNRALRGGEGSTGAAGGGGSA